MTLAEFNALAPAVAESALLDCCGATRWTKLVAGKRPFSSVSALYAVADDSWRQMQRADILEAFGRHPQIGQKADTGSQSHRQWSEGEQSGAQNALEDVKTRLARGNCATGKSAEEMLALLEQRLQNDAARELPVAAEQQRLIMRLRLAKLFAGEKAPL